MSIKNAVSVQKMDSIGKKRKGHQLGQKFGQDKVAFITPKKTSLRKTPKKPKALRGRP
jgi:hypothetical protein